MRKLWRRRTWPRWFRDEWLGEAGWALLVALRTYNPSRGASFKTHLWNTCWSRVSELQAWVNRDCRNEFEAVLPCEVLQPAEEESHPLLEEVWRIAEQFDPELVRLRYVDDVPVRQIRNFVRRTGRLQKAVRETVSSY